MPTTIRLDSDGAVQSSEGWAVRTISPDLLEYCDGDAACIVNVGYEPAQHVRSVYASESASELFPRLHERLQSAIAHFKGHYIVV